MKKRRRKSKKRLIYIRLVLILALILVMMNSFENSLSKYSSTATSTADVDLAFYFVKATDIAQELQLDSILPKTGSYTYRFSVSNFEGTKRTDTAIDYTIEMKTTTNLPLQYAVHRQNSNTNLITNSQDIADDDGTYFKYMTITGDSFGFTQNETHTYEIEITFPSQYNAAEYENIVEYIKLSINTSQKTS